MGYDLSTYIEYHFGKNDALGLSHVFQQLQVRMPQSGEFYEANDPGGAIVFLNSTATCIRITQNKKNPPVHHDRVLQPLITRQFPSLDARIDVYPGVRYEAHFPSKEELREVLKEDGILWHD